MTGPTVHDGLISHRLGLRLFDAQPQNGSHRADLPIAQQSESIAVARSASAARSMFSISIAFGSPFHDDIRGSTRQAADDRGSAILTSTRAGVAVGEVI